MGAESRTLIVGGGVVGLLTAVECVRAGQYVTVVERGPLPHGDASSYDRHRVMRALHPDDPGATRAAVTALRLWHDLESLLGARLLHPTGTLTVLPPDRAARAMALPALAGGRARILDSDQLGRQYGHLVFPADRSAVLEEDTGVLLADRVLTAAVRWLDAHPRARLRPQTTVTGVDPAARAVTVKDGRVLRADRVLLAAGAWSRPLLPAGLARRLVVHRQTMVYYDLPPREREVWRHTPAVPSFDTDWGAWLVPPVADTPLKLSADVFRRVVTEPGGRDPDPARAAVLARRFTGLIPRLRPEWVAGARDCHYVTDAVTSGALLADLADGAVLAHCACGGGAFKFAPLIARTLASRFAGIHPAPTGLGPLDNTATATHLATNVATEETVGDRLQRQNIPQHRGRT